MTDFNKLFPLPKNLYSIGYTPIIVPGNPAAGIEAGTYKITPSDLQGQALKAVAMVADATPVTLVGVPVLSPSIAAMRVTGSVTLVDVVSGDAASWDISALVTRNASTGLPALVGTSMVALFQAGPTMTDVPAPTLSASEYGISVSVAGIVGRQFAATSALVFG